METGRYSYWRTGYYKLEKNNDIPNDGVAESESGISTRQWHHVAITFSAGTTKFYIDRELDSEKDFGTSSFNTTSDGIKIGDREYTGDETDDFKGEMDEVRLYDQTLTGEEVQELYDGGGGIPTSAVPLASSFRMPIGKVNDGADLGNDLSLLERGYWPESGYPNLRFNDDGDQSPDTNEWYVATAHNKDESSIEPFDGDTAPYLESGAHHPGEDWNLTSGGSSDEGEPVLSAADGVVLHDGCVKNYGRTIILAHETTEGQFVTSFYAHLEEASPSHSVGETISKGETLGQIGGTNDAECSSGLVPHLHFEIRKQSMLDSEELSNGRVELRYDAGMWPAAGRSDGGEYFIGANYYTPSDFIAARSDVAPTGLTAEVGDGEVMLSWDESPDGDGYNVYRSEAPFSDITNATKQNTSPLPEPSYTDTDVDNSTAYYYRVTVNNNDGNEGPPSGQVSASLQKLQLLGLEVNQSVQTWSNSVPLVKGKETIVRVHLQNKREGQTPVNVALLGFRNGNLLEAPTLLNENYEAPPSPSPPEDSLELIRRRRADMEESLNFRLPNSWTQKPSVTLALVGQGIDCEKTPSMDENCETQVYFQQTATPKITVFSVGWEDGTGTTHLPDYDPVAVRNRLEAMYPVNNVDVIVGGERIVIPCGEDKTCGPPSPGQVNTELKDKWNNDFEDGNITKSRIYHGFVEDVKEGDKDDDETLGSARDIPADVAFTATNQDSAPLITAHEIGHVFGIQHAVNTDSTGKNDELLGWCGAEAAPPGNGYPAPIDFNTYVSHRIDLPNNEDWTGFTGISPVNQSMYNEVWGINTKKKGVIATSPHRENGANAELMSYCFDAEDEDIGILWASDTTYTTLRDNINARFDAGEEPVLATSPRSTRNASTPAASSSQEEDYLLVKGRINPEKGSLSFRSFSTITTSPDRAGAISPDAGDYTLQALDESGNVIEEVSFELSIGVSKTVSNIGTFMVPIPADPAIEEVQVLGGGEGNSVSTNTGAVTQADGNVLGSKSASPNPPTVTFQYPNGGEDLSGDEVTLKWTADDPDGDSLSYTVKYSRNSGSTWKALATSWPHDSLTVNTNALGGTSNGLIRVQASDGFNTAEDESDGTFGTSNVPPSASIFSPSDGAVKGQTGLITLDGSGSDTEDGSLSGPALKWQTASGDSLGIGQTIDVPAANFSLGTHTIELVATDSVGASDTASVSIQVSLSNDPSLLASASALVESDSLRDFGPTGTNIDFVGTSGAATVTAELYDSAPIGADGIPQSTVSHYRVLIEKQAGITIGPETAVRFETDILGGIDDPTEVQIYWRLAPSNGPFAALDTEVDSMGTPGDPSDDVIYAETSGFGEFVLASNSQPLPVELSDFDAIPDGQDAVRLTWTTAQETGNAGFRVQRNAGGGREGTWTTVGSVEGGGTTTEAKSYRYVDEELPYEADRLTYRQKQVDTDGSASYSKEVTVERSVKEVELLGTYPNPAQQRATVRYAVPEPQDVKIYLYDILGRRVQTVVDGEREGRHKRQLDVSRLASGVYFLRLQADGKTRTQKLTIVR